MEKEKMNYDSLYQIFQMERRSRGLTYVGKKFYMNAKNFITELQIKFMEMLERDPMSTRTLEMKEEYDKCLRLVRDIYDCRLRKILLYASKATHGKSPPPKNLTEEEEELYKEILEKIEEKRKTLLEFKRKDAKINNADKEEIEYVTIRVLEDLPHFVGDDEKVYALGKKSIARVPASTAKILEKSSKVEIIK